MPIRRAFVPLAAAAFMTLGASIAQAAPPEVQQHYSDAHDVLLPDPSDPNGYFCGGLTDVPLHVEIDGYFSIKSHGPTLRLPTSPTASACDPDVHQPRN